MIEERFVITWIDRPTLWNRVVHKAKTRCGVIQDSFPSVEMAVISMAEFYGVAPAKWVINNEEDSISAHVVGETNYSSKPMKLTYTICPLVSEWALDGIEMAF